MFNFGPKFSATTNPDDLELRGLCAFRGSAQSQVEAIFYLTATDGVNLSWMLAEEVSGIRMTSKFEFNSLRSRK